MKVQKESQSETYFKDTYLLYETLASTKTPEEMRNFLKDLLTRSELIMIHRRWHIGRMITQGGSIREIAYKAKVGTDTVVRLGKKIAVGTGVLKEKLKKIREQELKEASSFASEAEGGLKAKYSFG